MIENRLAFDEVSVRQALSSRRYLLEAAAEEVLGGVTVEELISSLRGHKDVSLRKKVDAIWPRVPYEIVSFCGLLKYSAEWWGAVVRLRNPALRENERDVYLGMIGWHNNHGTTAIVGTQERDKESALSWFEIRTRGKMEQGYKVECTLNNIQLIEEDIPEIPELSAIAETIDKEMEARRRRKDAAEKAAETRRRTAEEKERERAAKEAAVSAEEKARRITEGLIDKRASEVAEMVATERAEDIGLRDSSSGAVGSGVDGRDVAEPPKDEETGLRSLMRLRKKKSEW